MARVQGPLFSEDASGTIAKVITYAKWKGRNYVRSRVTPHNPRSGLQVGMRAMMRFLTQHWASGLSTGEKSSWNALGKSQEISPFNGYVQYNQRRTRQDLGVTNANPANPGAPEAAPTAVVATALPKGVVLTWTDSGGAKDIATLIYRSTTNGFTPSIANLIRVVAHGTQKYTDYPLVSGTPYYYVLEGTANDGAKGTAAAQVTATPT